MRAHKAYNTPKPKCESKPVSTLFYFHTSAVGGPVGQHIPSNLRMGGENTRNYD